MSVRLGVNGVNEPGGRGVEGPAGVCADGGACWATVTSGAKRQTTNTTHSVSRKQWFTEPRNRTLSNGVFSLFRARRVKEKGTLFHSFAILSLTLSEPDSYHSASCLPPPNLPL